MISGVFPEEIITQALKECQEYINEFPETEIFTIEITNKRRSDIDFDYEPNFSDNCKHYYVAASTIAQRFVPLLLKQYAAGKIKFEPRKTYPKTYKHVLLYPTAITPL